MYKTQQLQLRNLKNCQYQILKQLTFNSARLYNVAMYNIRQHYFQTKMFCNYNSNYHNCKNNDNYINLPSSAAQQTLRIADRNFKSFFSLIKKKNKSQYKNIVNIPNYLPKESHFILIYSKTGFRIKDNKIKLAISKECKNSFNLKELEFDFPNQINPNSVKEIRIIPKYNGMYFNMEIVYEIEKQNYNLNKNNVLSIDIGLNNLATCYDSNKNKAFILDGRKIKSINYFWNKQNAKLQSIKDKQNIKSYTKKQFLFKEKRNNQIKDIMRKTAKYIIDYCIENDIGTLIIGHNKEWKQNINLGKVTNQNFVQIPFGNLMSLLESKCEEYNIRYLEQQESHTSKCSALDSEEVKHHDIYLGKRIKRGLFKSSSGYLINADVNGAINIARKSKVTEIQFDTVNQIKGVLDHPLRIRVT